MGSQVELLNKETLDRLDDMEQQLKGMSGELLRINAETLKHQQQLKILDENDKRHQEELRSLYATQHVIKELVSNLGNQFSVFQSEVFKLLQQAQSESSKLLQMAQSEGTNERKNNQKEWMSFLKYVLGGTVLAIVGYIFGKG